MRIGITGASGLIGRSLLRYLESTHGPNTVSCFSGNILDHASATDWASHFGPSIVFHLAAKVPSRVAESEEQQVREINGHGPGVFASSLASVYRSKPLRIVYISTSHVYSPSRDPIAESGLIAPINFYGKTKLEGEKNLRLLEQRGAIRLTVVRLFSVFSSEQGPEYLYGSLQEKIRTGPEQSISLPGWNNVRDFLHVDEAAAKIAQLGSIDFDGTVNLGSGRGLTVKSFAEERFGVKLITSDADKAPRPTSLVANVGLMNKLLSDSLP